MTDLSASSPHPRREILGHPRGLAICFLTEMWERFSYYGMRALLIFYLTQHFLFSQGESALIYGTYISLVYVMPMIGGFLADRYLGSRKAVTLGAILLVFGHAGMTLEGAGAREYLVIDGERYEVLSDGRGESRESFVNIDGAKAKLRATSAGLAVDSDGTQIPIILTSGSYDREVERDAGIMSIFYLSLALIISGVGFLKPNISTIVGALYEANDPRRDPGFTIFYMGINLGSFLAVLACGYLGEVWGWAYGFGLAGIGMLVGLIVFWVGQPWLDGRADPPDPAKLKAPGFLFLNVEWSIYIGSVLMVASAWLLMNYRDAVSYLLNGFAVIAFGSLIYFAIRKCTREDRDRMLVAIFLTLCQVPFWALFEQTGSSLNLFTRDAVDRVFFGWEIPASWFLSLNAMFIFMLAPLFAWLWLALARRKAEPTTPVKFAIAIAQVGLGFLVLVFGIQASGGDAKTAWIWIALIYLLHTTGELCISPVGLSMITKLSVGKVVGAMMGGWMLAQAFAGYLSGLIASNTGAETIGGQITDLAAAKAGYISVYTQIGWVAIGFAVFVLALSPILKKRMHGIH